MGREKREEGGNEATVARMEECSSYYLPTGMLIPTSARGNYLSNVDYEYRSYEIYFQCHRDVIHDWKRLFKPSSASSTS